MAVGIGSGRRKIWRWLLVLGLLGVPYVLQAQDEPAPTEAPQDLGFETLGEQDGQSPAELMGGEEAEPTEPAEPAAHAAAEPAGGHAAPAAGHGEGGEEHGGGGGHSDPVTPILFGLVLILAGAKIGGAIFLKFHQPAVLGELVCGVVFGNVLLLLGLEVEQATDAGGLLGWYATFVHSTVTHGSAIDILARIGVVLLLFQVGLESNLKDMMKVGATSFWVATIGVVCPFLLGLGVSYFFLPPRGEHEILVHVYIGAVLTATSVGITARVLQELGRLNQKESRIILGAAVIDDVMGLVVLAVVAGIITAQGQGTEPAIGSMLLILVKAIVFLVVAVVGGQWLSPRLFRLASKLQGEGVLLITALMICFVLAAVANLIGLAPIVGAFAAGLLLDEVHYADFMHRGSDHHIEELLEPVAAFLVPVFFVQMGMTVHLSTFANVSVLGFAALLTVAAIIGKQSCGLVVPKGLDRISVGVGMIPRGEVGLIFAAIGASLYVHGERVISDSSNAAVVIMVIVTTMVTPPILQLTLKHGDKMRAAHEAASDGPPTPPEPEA